MTQNFEAELRSIFLDEAGQLLSEAEQCFLRLEDHASDPTLIEKIFRLAHNLKGSANAVGFLGLGEFTHEFESYLLRIKSGELVVDAPCIDLLLRCNDLLLMMVTGLRADGNATFDYGTLLLELRSPKSGAPASAAPPGEPVAEAIAGFHSFEAAAPVIDEPVPPPKAPQKAKARVAPAVASDESIRVSLDRIEKLVNLVGELAILQTVLKEQSQQTPTGPLLRKTVHQLGKVTKDVQDLAMSLRMVQLKPIFQKMQRIVRDTSGSLGKTVKLELVGDETEVDKTVLERLSDPLVHLIRNAVDHGVEAGADRLAAGKSEAGTVTLAARHQSSNLVIEIRDDGAGLDADRLKAKAVEKGILNAKAAEALSDRDAYNLIFASGFSTKAVVSDVSGRGVGMDVVKTNIEEIQGEVLVDTVLGKGTTFTIRLPLTMAIIDGMTAICGDDRYVIPLAHIHETTRPAVDDVHTTAGLGEVYVLRGESLPLFRLSQLLGHKTPPKKAADGIAVVVRTTAQPFAVLVDDVVGQSQIVIKQLGPEHRDLRGFSGSAIMGDGRATLILELPELVSRFKGATAPSSMRRSAA